MAACATSHGLHWLGVCLQCSHVDNLCKSPATVLLLGLCFCDHNSVQLHLFGHPGQASLWGDVDTAVVGWPHCDALWPRAAAHCCTPANARGGEEGVVRSLLSPFPAWIMFQLLPPPGPNLILTPCTSQSPHSVPEPVECRSAPLHISPSISKVMQVASSMAGQGNHYRYLVEMWEQ